MAAFRLDDTPEPEKKQQAEKYRLDDPQFVKKLAALHYSKDVTELVTKKAKAPSLSRQLSKSH